MLPLITPALKGSLVPEDRSGNVIEQALAYWEAIRGERLMPSRADVDPADIAQVLPFVMLVDVLRAPTDFRFRLIGTEIDLILSRSYTGIRFSEIPHMARGNRIWTEYMVALRSRRPRISQVSYVGTIPYVRSVRHCLMPLAADGTTVDMMFVAVEIVRR